MVVHPSSEKPKDDPRFVASLDTGININEKMKNLANNTTDATTDTQDTKIATIAKVDSLPTGFTPSEANTITTSTSAQPVYIFFDDTIGTMYYYTEANDIILNSASSYMFRYLTSLTNIDALADWDTSSVTNMFYNASSLTNINGASNWNTGNVTNISSMFRNVNNINATVLNNWNVSKVTDKSNAFTCPEDKRPSWY